MSKHHSDSLKTRPTPAYCSRRRVRVTANSFDFLKQSEISVSMITHAAGLGSPVMRSIEPSATALDRAIESASACILSKQAPEGYWCAELQGDSILESEY